MNVLILTPDAVGSTLLQRMLTIYMQFHEFDRPVINLHELTNGLARYYSPEFNREIVGKKEVKNWGYYQTLQEVAELLGSVDHYKTSRLAHYHIRQRGDTVPQQIPFYKYLNDNFYIVACRRANVFEHALSMTLNKITKKLNVYDAYEKIDTFYEIYQSGVTLDEQVFVKQLNAYREYIQWSEQHFNIGSYFNYEQDLPRIEQYILELPVFAGQTKQITWEKNFGISFNDWNKMHYARSDLTNLVETVPELKKLAVEKLDIVSAYQQHAPSFWPAVTSKEDFDLLPVQLKDQLPSMIINQQGLIPFLNAEKQKKLIQYQDNYASAQKTIDQMVDLGILINGPPIKKQTLAEKRKIIKNFDCLTEIYNSWAAQNSSVSAPVTQDGMRKSATQETQFWESFNDPAAGLSVLLPGQQ
jgi:hypothetical protein